MTGVDPRRTFPRRRPLGGAGRDEPRAGRAEPTAGTVAGSWRWVFLVNVPVGVFVGLVNVLVGVFVGLAGRRLLHESRDPGARGCGVDLVSAGGGGCSDSAS